MKIKNNYKRQNYSYNGETHDYEESNTLYV